MASSTRQSVKRADARRRAHIKRPGIQWPASRIRRRSADRLNGSRRNSSPLGSDSPLFRGPIERSSRPGRRLAPASTGFMSKPYQLSSLPQNPSLQICTARIQTTAPRKDYLPIFDSPSADLQRSDRFRRLWHCRYPSGINDYAGVDVNNCIVLFLRGKPDHFKAPSVTPTRSASLERGAFGYLTATGPILSPYEARRGVTGRPSAFYGQLQHPTTSPAHGSAPHGRSASSPAPTIPIDRLRTLQEQLNRASESRSLSTEYFGSLQWEPRQEQEASDQRGRDAPWYRSE